MAKVVSTLFISPDGVAEIDPDWHFPYFDENMGRAVGEDYDTVDVLLIGRVTYDSFAGAWPDREAAGGDDAPFAKQTRRRAQGRRLAPAAGVRLAQLRADRGRPGRGRHRAQGGRRSRASSSPARSPWCSSCSPRAGRRAAPAGAPGGGAEGPQALRRRRRALPPEGDGDGGVPDGRDPGDLLAGRRTTAVGYDEVKDQVPGAGSGASVHRSASTASGAAVEVLAQSPGGGPLGWGKPGLGALTGAATAAGKAMMTPGSGWDRPR